MRLYAFSFGHKKIIKMKKFHEIFKRILGSSNSTHFDPFSIDENKNKRENIISRNSNSENGVISDLNSTLARRKGRIHILRSIVTRIAHF